MKKRKYFTLKKKRKIQVLFVFALVAFVILNATIVWIQNVKGEEYEKIVLEQQNFESKVIAFRRGDIKDCNGTLLATSQKVYNMVLDCRVLNNLGKKYMDRTVSVIAQCFPEFTKESLQNTLSEKKDSNYIMRWEEKSIRRRK